MSRRLDRVQIALNGGGIVVIPWASRDDLLAEIVHLESMWPVVAAFRAVGATRPVELTRMQEVGLLDLIEAWSTRAGSSGLPSGISALRSALRDDLHEARK